MILSLGEVRDFTEQVQRWHIGRMVLLAAWVATRLAGSGGIATDSRAHGWAGSKLSPRGIECAAPSLPERFRPRLVALFILTHNLALGPLQ